MTAAGGAAGEMTEMTEGMLWLLSLSITVGVAATAFQLRKCLRPFQFTTGSVPEGCIPDSELEYGKIDEMFRSAWTPRLSPARYYYRSTAAEAPQRPPVAQVSHWVAAKEVADAVTTEAKAEPTEIAATAAAEPHAVEAKAAAAPESEETTPAELPSSLSLPTRTSGDLAFLQRASSGVFATGQSLESSRESDVAIEETFVALDTDASGFHYRRSARVLNATEERTLQRPQLDQPTDVVAARRQRREENAATATAPAEMQRRSLESSGKRPPPQRPPPQRPVAIEETGGSVAEATAAKEARSAALRAKLEAVRSRVEES